MIDKINIFIFIYSNKITISHINQMIYSSKTLKFQFINICRIDSGKFLFSQQLIYLFIIIKIYNPNVLNIYIRNTGVIEYWIIKSITNNDAISNMYIH